MVSFLVEAQNNFDNMNGFILIVIKTQNKLSYTKDLDNTLCFLLL